ncbi:MAG TPA: cytochrome c oxidase subunit II [Geminicoccaceae bacterium]|nr:cytochrome c oxidase subunit II [Geminicoccaceae bacterium]
MPLFLPLLLFASLLLMDGTALAQGTEAAAPVIGGAPTAWQINFQPAASPVAERIEALHDLLLFVTVAISVLVFVLLMFVCIRYRASRSPVPSRRTHNTALEIAWTAIPVLILVVIAIPSFKLLYFMDRAVAPEMTLKAVGHQWYWSYEYPDHGDFTFDAYMIANQDLQEGQLRLFDVDNRVVLPVDTDVRVLTTATDVIHSWAVPALGIKLDAIPGKVNETWVRIERPGIYYGQCSELCGAYHGFMPVMIEAVSKEEFDTWVEQAREQYARADGFDVADRQEAR